MPYFKDESEIYACMGRLFEDLLHDDELRPRIQEANTIVQYRCRNPAAQLTVTMVEGMEALVDFGPTEQEPEIVMVMDADLAHRYWLGKVNIMMAVARGKIKAKGPAAKLLKLVPLTKPIFARYRAILEETGRHDLLNI